MNIIVVVDENWNIGRDGGLLVHLPGDLKYFKEQTYGKTVVVGRKTLESFPGARPLPGRTNAVLTTKEDYSPEGCKVFHTKEALLQQVGTGEDIFIAGGENVYRQFIEDCHAFFITKIYDNFPADRSFPNLDEMDGLKIIWKSEIQEERGIKYQFFKYIKEVK